MAASSAESKTATGTDGVTPSATVRGVITYLLFLHFFFLLVGIKSGTSSSGLDQDLRRKVPGIQPYLQLFAMDLSYMFHLTHYNGQQQLTDTDYRIEADIPQSDGSVRSVVIESAATFPPIRDYRYRQLAYTAATAASGQDDSMASILPQAVARRLMLENGANQLTLRIRRRLLKDAMIADGMPGAAAEKARDPDDPSYFDHIYEARAFMTSDGLVDIAEIKADYDTAAPAGTPPRPSEPAATAVPPTATPTATPVIPGSLPDLLKPAETQP